MTEAGSYINNLLLRATMPGTTRVRILWDRAFNPEIFHGYDEGISEEVYKGFVLTTGADCKSLKEFFTTEKAGSSRTVYFTDKSRAVYRADKLDGKNYLFKARYETKGRVVSISYNSKTKVTSCRIQLGGHLFADIISKYDPSSDTFNQTLTYPIEKKAKGIVTRKFKRERINELEVEGKLHNRIGDMVFKLFCDEVISGGNIKEAKVNYSKGSIYPVVDNDSGSKTEFAMVCAATGNPNSDICELRFKDKLDKEWYMVFNDPKDPGIAEKYFKRNLADFIKVNFNNGYFLVPYADAELTDEPSFDNLVKNVFGKRLESFFEWIETKFDFYIENIVPVGKGPSNIVDYYDIVRDWD
ncbi:MAG: hypothetical protein ABIH00_11640 [Armatimonadota bacterium]